MKSMIFLSSLMIFSTSIYASTPKELVEKNCASCHLLTVPTPEMMPKFKAPAMEAVLFHVKDAVGNDKKVKAFILNYVQNPDIKKSVCESNKVVKFGVMPSLKGKVSPEDLDKIVDYLIESYPTKPFVTMLTTMLTNDKLTSLKNSPFLMNQSALPHLTKVLLQSWEKGSLNLSDEQKKKLLVVRKETMSGVKRIKMALSDLESEIIEMTVEAEPREKIKPLVDKVATLKAEGTMIHIKCLQDSVEILTDEQRELLLPFW